MRFDDLASEAGKTAQNVGKAADRPAFARVLSGRRRRMLIEGWSTASAVVLVILGTVLLWPGSGSESTATAVTSNTTLTDGTVTGSVDGGREACAITEPGDTPFTPASQTPPGAPPGSDWYGTPELWTRIDHLGEVWADLPVGPDGSLTQKTFWWSEDFDIGEELEPDITVTAESVGGLEPAVKAGGPATHGTHLDLGSFMIVGLEVPREGCWRITAEYRDTALSFVVWVDGPSTTSTTPADPDSR